MNVRLNAMEELFSSNLFAIYIIACIAVISYTNFKENQRMFLLYLFTYATAFFGIFRIAASIILLFLITFIFLEYLTEDTKKLTLITNLFYKVCDYLFMMFFQYHFFWILISFVILHLSHYNCMAVECQNFLKAISIATLFLGTHLSISQPFKIKSITDMCQVFEVYPPYQFEYREEMQEKFNLLCAFEEKTYFQRQNSYSCLSFEYIKCFLKKHGFPRFIFFKNILSNVSTPRKLARVSSRLFKRGYSTPEMQLLRTIGIVRGYDKYKIQRKIFEILYSKIILSSLKEYHKANTYLALAHYRHYLLYVYFQTVMTKINGIKCTPFSSAFINQNDISNWSMDGLFVACLGLSFRKVSDYSLTLFSDIIEEFGLSRDRIKELNSLYPQKFPLEDTQCH